MARSNKPIARRSRTMRVARWFLFFAVLLAIIDAVGYEPRYPVLVTYHIGIPNLPREMDGFRMVQLSDLHRSRTVPDSAIRRAVEIANSTSPDVAVLTGDFVSSTAKNAEPCAEMLEELHSRCGSYAVLGNHDYWTDARVVRKTLEKHHITVLKNANIRLPGGLYLAGIDDQWSGKPDVNKMLKGIRAKDARVMLSHSPLALPLLKGKSGLLITGHTHGGQVQIPFIPRNRLPGLRGWKYINGWYRDGDILMYVNRGIGMVNPAVRFRCRSEVTLYILHPATSSAPTLIRR